MAKRKYTLTEAGRAAIIAAAKKRIKEHPKRPRTKNKKGSPEWLAALKVSAAKARAGISIEARRINAAKARAAYQAQAAERRAAKAVISAAEAPAPKPMAKPKAEAPKKQSRGVNKSKGTPVDQKLFSVYREFYKAQGHMVLSDTNRQKIAHLVTDRRFMQDVLSAHDVLWITRQATWSIHRDRPVVGKGGDIVAVLRGLGLPEEEVGGVIASEFDKEVLPFFELSIDLLEAVDHFNAYGVYGPVFTDRRVLLGDDQCHLSISASTLV